MDRMANVFVLLLSGFVFAGFLSGFQDKVMFSFCGGVLVWMLVRTCKLYVYYLLLLDIFSFPADMLYVM